MKFFFGQFGYGCISQFKELLAWSSRLFEIVQWRWWVARCSFLLLKTKYALLLYPCRLKKERKGLTLNLAETYRPLWGRKAKPSWRKKWLRILRLWGFKLHGQAVHCRECIQLIFICRLVHSARAKPMDSDSGFEKMSFFFFFSFLSSYFSFSFFPSFLSFPPSPLLSFVHFSKAPGN